MGSSPVTGTTPDLIFPAGGPSTMEDLLDRQQQVNPTAIITADYLSADGAPDHLKAVLGGLLLSEDRDFHTIQTLEGAVRQSDMVTDAARDKIFYIAAARYLAAHPPTMRSQNQTFTIALRLARGENLFE